MAREHEVSLICLDAGEETSAFRVETQPAQAFLQVRYERGFLDKFRDPFDVPGYLSAGMAGEIDRFVGAAQFDVVFCAFPFALSLLRLSSLRHAENVVYLEDDLSFEVFKERSRKAGSLPRRLHMGARWLQAEAFYRRLMPRVRSFVAISEEEAAIVRRKYPHLQVAIVGYGIPLEEYPVLDPPLDGAVLGFIGNYIHPSNFDAIRFFLAEWYPAVRARHPGASLRVAGKNLPADLIAEWQSDPSVSFHANVPNLRDFYAGISIFVNPIVSQRGLRTKLVEAAAFGRPIISTELGAEGLDGLALLRADTAAEFLRAFEQLQNPAALHAAAASARAAVERLYSIEAIVRPLAHCLQQSACALA